MTPAQEDRTALTRRVGPPKRPRALVVLGAALSIATVLGACGDRTPSTPKQVGAGTVTTQGPTTSVTPPAPSTTQTVAPAGTTLPPTRLPVTTTTPSRPPKPTGTDVQFTMPSGNIGCTMRSDGVVRCDIRQRDWAHPARPADCNPNYDFGQGLVLGTTARFVCATDTALVGAPVLPYGSSRGQGPYQCRSGENGVECTNLDTGHGFLLSAAEYRLF